MIDGSPYTDTLSKAEALSKQFKSVFTHEDLENIPTISSSSDSGNLFPIMSDISFSTNGIQAMVRYACAFTSLEQSLRLRFIKFKVLELS